MQDRIESKSRLERRLVTLGLGDLLVRAQPELQETTKFTRVDETRTRQFVRVSEPYERIDIDDPVDGLETLVALPPIPTVIIEIPPPPLGMRSVIAIVLVLVVAFAIGVSLPLLVLVT